MPSAYIIDCRDELGFDMFWTAAWERSWYGPLRYVGPIEVAVQARRWPEQPLPLFVEIRTDPRAAQCISDAGGPTWATYGTASCNPDSLWSAMPRTALELPLDATYWVQLSGYYVINYPTRASSPFVACVRVRSYPTAVLPSTWGQIKRLYR